MLAELHHETNFENEENKVVELKYCIGKV